MAGSFHPLVGTKLRDDVMEQGAGRAFCGAAFRLVLEALKLQLMSPDLGLKARGAQRSSLFAGSAAAAAAGGISEICSLLLPFRTEEPQHRVSQWGQGLFGQLSSVAGVCVCVCLWVTQSGPHAPSRENSIMEIVWWPSGSTGSRSKLALEYFELAVMKANGNLPCLQA